MKINLVLPVLFLCAVFAVEAQETWVVQNSGTKANLNAINCPNANICYAVGDSGVILKDSNGAVTWTKQASGTATPLVSLTFTDALNGYVVKNDGGVLKTTDGGASWLPQSGFPAFSDLFFADANNGHGLGSSIQNTTDAGLTWTSSPSPWASNGETFRAVRFVDAKVGYVVTHFFQFYVVSDIYGYTAYLWWNNLYKTTDGGTTWNGVSQVASGGGSGIGPSIDNTYSFYFLDENSGYALKGASSLLKTTDGGITWNEQFAGTSRTLRCIGFRDANTAYAVGDSGTLLETANGGANWSAITAWSGRNNFNAISVLGNTNYVVGSGGIIIKKTGAIIPLGIKSVSGRSGVFRSTGGSWYGFELPNHHVFNLLGRQPVQKSLPVSVKPTR